MRKETKRLPVLLTFVLLSMNADAETLENVRHSTAVNIESVRATISEDALPLTHVKAKAVFSNPCRVPRTDELVSIIHYGRVYSTLNIALGVLNTERVCTEDFNPVTVTIDLGRFSHPTDGTFSKVAVNRVSAILKQRFSRSEVLTW